MLTKATPERNRVERRRYTMTFDDKGIILRETASGESDKSATILFRDHGKLNVSVRGAKKPGSKFLAAVQPFCLSNFVVYHEKKQNNSFYSAAQADLINNFYGIREDYDAFCYASFISELTDKLYYPEIHPRDTFELLFRTFSAISKGKTPPKLAASVYQLRVLGYEGFSPELDKCRVCGASVYGSSADCSIYFDGESVICSICDKAAFDNEIILGKRRKLTANATAAASYIINTDLNKLYSFSLSSSSDIDSLYDAVTFFRETHIDAHFKSLELI